jgi:hypothetical protein
VFYSYIFIYLIPVAVMRLVQSSLRVMCSDHRYLRKVDCLTHVSLWNIHYNTTQALVASTKQKEILGSPDCPMGMLALLSAHYWGLLFSVFAGSIDKKFVPLSSLFFNMSLWFWKRDYFVGNFIYLLFIHCFQIDYFEQRHHYSIVYWTRTSQWHRWSMKS